MDTLKTAAVVVLLLAVLYGVYVVLNRPGEGGLPQVWSTGGDTASAPPLDIELPDAPTSPDEIDGGGLREIEPPGMPAQLAASPTYGGSTTDGSSTDQSPWNESTGQEPPRPDAQRIDFERVGDGSSNGGAWDPQPSHTPDAAAENRLVPLDFRQDWQSAQRLLAEGRYRETLELLTKYYQSPDLSEAEQQALLDALDALAGKVIYSTEPLLGDPLYEINGENLYDLASKYSVPWELLRNINGLRQPDVVLRGTKVKVVPGPFRAEVSLSKRQLTLFLGDMYAGRFDVGFGDEPAPQGTYTVQRKDPGGMDYYSPRGNFAKGNPDNPYGLYFIDLGKGVSIHGSPSAGGDQKLGCISLAPRDAEDVSAILSERSIVTIRP